MKQVSKLSAQKGFVASPPVIIGAIIVVAIIAIAISSGALKFSGYLKVDDSNKTQNDQTKSETPATTVIPTEKPKAAVKFFSEPFSDAKLGFSISYIEGWKVREDTSAVTMFKPSETKGAEQADALVTVMSGSIGDLTDTKLSTLADLQKVQLKKLFSDVKIIREGDTKVGEKVAYEIEFTGTMNKEKMHAKYIVLTTSSKLFAILAGANAGLWGDSEGELNASVQTFKLQ